MAKAKTLVGLDVHATKMVAVVLDAETRQLQTFVMGGENATAAAFCAGFAAAGAGCVWGRPDRVRARAGAREASRGKCGGGAEQDPARERGSGEDRSSGC
jgi:hypothetical protein